MILLLLQTADPSLTAVAQNLTASFNGVKEFCDSHKLVITSSTTQLIQLYPVGKRIPNDFNLRLDNCYVQPQMAVKLLGVTLNHLFTISPHIDNIVNKCHGHLGTLVRATPYIPTQLLKLSYTAVIRTHMEYCSFLFKSAA